MIIQSLYQRYNNLVQDPASGISPPHYSVANVSFVLEIDEHGNVTNVVDVREDKGKKKVPIHVVVPDQGEGRSSNIKPYFLCDKAEYLLGHCTDPMKERDAVRKFESSKQLHISLLKESNCAEATAVKNFFINWNRDAFESDPKLKNLTEQLVQSTDNVLVFRLQGSRNLLHDNVVIRNIWARHNEVDDDSKLQFGQCLIIGEQQVPISRIHSVIKGVKDSHTAGARIVSFNCESFTSYGKEESYNAPVSQQAAFGYTTALNHMLASPKHTMRNIGDMTVVFWSDPVKSTDNEHERFFKGFFVDEAPEKEDMGLTEQVKGGIDRIRKGMKLAPDMLDTRNVPFYVLGLSPNNARLSVRFYWQSEFGSILDRIMEHVEEMAIEKPSFEHQGHPPLFYVLGETVRKGKDSKDKISPSLAGDWFRAIIQGTMYPYSMIQAIIQRIRVDGIINSTRVSVIKAYLIRYARIHRLSELKEVLTVSLNKETTNTAYRLGRLFSVLERAQEDASNVKLNATIKDRYFSSASATPSVIFPILMRLAQHHMSKAEYGNLRDREIQEILQGVEEFPKHMNLNQQGLFILGYYHQKQYRFTQKTETKGEDNE